jgi:hypothetical protein
MRASTLPSRLGVGPNLAHSVYWLLRLVRNISADLIARTCYPFPPVTRALKYATAKLEAAGVKTVTWEPYDHKRGWEILRCLYFPDAAEYQKDILAKGGELIHPLTEWAFAGGRPQPITLAENWELNAQREEYRAEYVKVHHSFALRLNLTCPVTTVL